MQKLLFNIRHQNYYFINKNRVFYYFSEENSLNELINFNEDHSFSCIFLDSESKNIYTKGGKFSFEKQNL